MNNEKKIPLSSIVTSTVCVRLARAMAHLQVIIPLTMESPSLNTMDNVPPQRTPPHPLQPLGHPPCHKVTLNKGNLVPSTQLP